MLITGFARVAVRWRKIKRRATLRKTTSKYKRATACANWLKQARLVARCESDERPVNTASEGNYLEELTHFRR